MKRMDVWAYGGRIVSIHLIAWIDAWMDVLMILYPYLIGWMDGRSTG